MTEAADVSVVKSNGVTYFEVGDWLMAVIIPSRKRLNRVVNHPLLPVANVLVYHTEKAEYEDGLAGYEYGSLLTHNVHGMGQITNSIIEQGYQDERCRAVLRIDDDWRGFLWMMTRGQPKKIKDFPTLLGISAHLAQCCLDANIGIFSVNMSPRPQARSALQPFILRGWVTGRYLGICNRDIRSHDLVGMEDVDVSLRSMQMTGMIWIDQRFHPIHESKGTGFDKGGIADLRTYAQNDEDLRKMADYWPGVVEPLWGERMPSGMTRQKIHIPK